MELRRLRYFQVIAEEGSLTRASRALDIAQPALGRQMQLLEEQLGVKLFVRAPKGMLLTDEGRYLQNALRGPMNELTAALKNVQTYPRSVEVTVNLGLYSPISRLYGAPLLRELREKLPHVTVRVYEDNALQLRKNLENGVVDIAITMGTPTASNFEMLVAKEPLFLLASEESDYSQYSSITVRMLSNIPLILDSVPGITATTLEKIMRKLGGSLMVDREINSVPITIELVRSGYGCSVMAQSDVQYEDMRGLRLLPLDLPDISRSIYYAVRKDWSISQSNYAEIDEVIFKVWRNLVHNQIWKADWVGIRGLPESL